MSVIEYIILAFALALPTFITMRACALKNPIRLSMGLVFSFLIALEHALLLLLGIWIGNFLRFGFSGFPEFDDLVFLGLFVVVALRMFFSAFWKKDKELPAFDISRLSTVLLLGVATGTNVLFIGLGLGFRVLFADTLYRAALPLLIVTFLLSYWGVMLGRRKKDIRPRRWLLIAVLFLLVCAIKGAFFA